MPIDDGLERYREALAPQKDLASKQWLEIKNKIDGFLQKGKMRPIHETQVLCRQMDNMSHADRIIFVQEKFGPRYFAQVEPLLYQLHSVESSV